MFLRNKCLSWFWSLFFWDFICLSVQIGSLIGLHRCTAWLTRGRFWCIVLLKEKEFLSLWSYSENLFVRLVYPEHASSCANKKNYNYIHNILQRCYTLKSYEMQENIIHLKKWLSCFDIWNDVIVKYIHICGYRPICCSVWVEIWKIESLVSWLVSPGLCEVEEISDVWCWIPYTDIHDLVHIFL